MRREPSILHVDLDAMFAAVEQRDKVSLRGIPVIVGGVAGRGVVATASYEARRFGARSAMPMAQARRLCPPNTAFLSPRFPAYQRTSAVVMELLAGVSPLVEQVSIDEAYVDLAAGGHDLSLRGVTELAHRLKAEIAVVTGGVTGSIGAASSKLLAKIGSDLNKPDGVTIVPAGEELAVLHPLPVRRLGGVGPATEQRLHRSGIRTVGDLAARPLDDLVDWFGTAHGHGLYRLARAEDNRPVVSEREAKSVSAEETFDVDLNDPGRLNRELDLLATRVAGRLRRSGLTGRTVNIKVRHPDFTTVTRAVTRDQPTDDGRLIAQLARRLLAELNTSGGVRLLGVGVSTLADFAQDDLFTAAGEDPPFYSFPSPAEEASPAGAPSPTAAGLPSLSAPPVPVPSATPLSSKPSSLSAGAVGPSPSAASAAMPLSSADAVSSSAASVAMRLTSAGSVAQSSSGGSVSPSAASAATPPPFVDSSPAPPSFEVPTAAPLLPAPSSSATPASSPATPTPPAATPSVAGAALPAVPDSDSSSSAARVSGSPWLAASSSASPSSAPVSFSGPPALSGPPAPPTAPVWRPGQDVRHDEYGAGWVRGSGIGRVTVRFEGPHTPPGRVRTFFVDDPALHPADPPDWTVPAPDGPP
ncbi:DNA polymerase IV [Actinoplanes sp. NEAU-A12]|uniref:DNA polymerase IV n=1 Tax=Actinoplanes sandaracinus TaxID=3045177 RepID=A0ABT6WRZ5_9ACTN|nr:DNA polymerase IV [Actinoplanes sandaracinus]MDI6102502.1 DNA polymerase IV [Actinoplanes sandaracinus]